MSFTLLLDTSTERGIVALEKEGVCLFQEPLPFGMQTSRHLPKVVKGLLEKASLSLSDLSYIAVGTGPGLMTGVRVAVAFAQGCRSLFKFL